MCRHIVGEVCSLINKISCWGSTCDYSSLCLCQFSVFCICCFETSPCQNVISSVCSRTHNYKASYVGELYYVMYWSAACIRFRGGWTITIFIRDFSCLYETTSTGTKKPDAALAAKLLSSKHFLYHMFLMFCPLPVIHVLFVKSIGCHGLSPCFTYISHFVWWLLDRCTEPSRNKHFHALY